MLTPGKDTSEFAVAKWLGVAGVGSQLLAGVLSAFIPGPDWSSVAVSLSGAAMGIAGALGYQVPRARAKMQEMHMSAKARRAR